MRYTLNQIVDCLKGEDSQIISNNPDVLIGSALPAANAQGDSVVWIKPGAVNTAALITETRATCVICDKLSYELVKEKNLKKVFLITDEPRRIFSKIVNQLFVKVPSPGIHPTAFIHPRATIGEGCYIGPFTYIGEATIGSNTVIHGHCHVYNQVKIGSHCIVHAGAVIGSDGFGFTKNKIGDIEKFPHIGGVVINDHVEIGANTCIDRGALGDTIIENGVKIDNLVHVAHNVVIQSNAFIIANAMIGGSTQIGKGAWIAPSVSLLQQLHIGENATIGVGAVVTKNVPAKETWAGTPALPLKEFQAQQKKIKNLPPS